VLVANSLPIMEVRIVILLHVQSRRAIWSARISPRHQQGRFPGSILCVPRKHVCADLNQTHAPRLADIHKAVWQNRVDHQAENWIACFPNVLDDSNTIDHYFWLNSIDCLSDAVEVISIYAGLNPDPSKTSFSRFGSRRRRTVAKVSKRRRNT